jgi:hypothetical protein
MFVSLVRVVFFVVDNQGEDVLKLRARTGGRKVGLLVLVDVLEHNCDNIVADVALAFELLPRVFDIRQLRGHVKHDLVALVDRVHRVLTGCVSFQISKYMN